MKEAVIGILFNEQREILLIKRSDVPVWVLPGGGVDNGESPDHAVVRELFEETGLQSKIIRKIAEYTPINHVLAGFTHVYECQATSYTLSISDETKDVRFFSLQRLPKSFFFIHLDWLNDALKDKDEVIKTEITQVTIWKLILYFLKHPILVLRFIAAKLPLWIKG